MNKLSKIDSAISVFLNVLFAFEGSIFSQSFFFFFFFSPNSTKACSWVLSNHLFRAILKLSDNIFMNKNNNQGNSYK